MNIYLDKNHDYYFYYYARRKFSASRQYIYIKILQITA